MTKTLTKSEKRAVSTVFMYFSLIGAITFIVIGSLALWANNFTGTMVRGELAAQKIFFPEKGTKALDPAEYPTLQKYAGQRVDTPQKAKAYANDYIGHHLFKMADGKSYAEVGALAAKDPDNKQLAQLKQTLFQGETLRGMLLTSGYGFGTIGLLAGVATYVAFSLSLALLVIAIYFYKKI